MGILTDPLGEVSAGTVIRITALDTEDTLKCMEGTTTTDSLGNYSFSLVNGTHSVEVNFSDEFCLISDIVVDPTTPTPITLPALLEL